MKDSEKPVGRVVWERSARAVVGAGATLTDAGTIAVAQLAGPGNAVGTRKPFPKTRKAAEERKGSAPVPAHLRRKMLEVHVCEVYLDTG